MRGEKRVQAVIAQTSLERDKPNPLQHHVPPGIGQHFFFDPVPPVDGHVLQLIGGYSRFVGQVFKCTMAFFLGEPRMAVGDDQPNIARAGLVYARKVHFVQNAMTDCEPDAALKIQRCARAGLGARRPARFNPRPTRSVSNFIHQWSPLPVRSVPEDRFPCWR